MATIIKPAPVYNYANTAKYVQMWFDVLEACGWEHVPFSGHVDPSNAPTTSGGSGAFVFRSTDELSDVAPIYIRFSLSLGNHGVFANPFISAYTVSFEISSSGVPIDGHAVNVLNAVSSYPSYISPSSYNALFASGDGGSLRVCAVPERYAYNSAYPNRGVHAMTFIALSRTKDEDGNPTPDGVVMHAPPVSMANDYLRMGLSVHTPDGSVVSRSRSLCAMLTEEVAITGKVASVGGMPQMQHPWACTPRLYPFEDMGYFPNYGALSVGDILKVNQGGVMRDYLYVGRTGYCPSAVGYSGNPSATDNADLIVTAGMAILWE